MTTDTKISLLDQLKTAIKQFEAAQSTYSSFGAQDTEPNAIFASIMRKTARGIDVDVPSTGDGWELYASTMDCSQAAEALHQAAKAAVEVIQDCPLGKSAELREYIKGWYEW
jgi:hypothetical protein